jgi:membrane protein
LIWIYYSAQILFLGAEFTQVYANRYGSRIVPKPDAEPLTEEARAQQRLTRQGSQPAADARQTAAGSPATSMPAVSRLLPAPPKKNLLYYMGMTMAVLASMWFSVRHGARP